MLLLGNMCNFLLNFCSAIFILFLCKRKRYQPTVRKTTARFLTEKSCEIMVGPVEEKGKNLLSGHNRFEYIDIRGRIDVVRIFSDHSKVFPTLWIIAQRDSSRRVVEVGCECFFGLSG